MIKAKKIILILAVFLLIGNAAASQYTPKYGEEADILNALGLFNGTDKGYELDRAPTRTEALVLLVRLLGSDSEAKDCTAANPFTDVPSWADRYVAWAYSKGLTKGISEDMFGSAGNVSARMFITFALRALGYDDSAGDFSYEKAIQKAEETGLIAAGSYDESTEFMRDDCVHICFNALTTKMISGDMTLIEQLVNDGAVSMETAAEYDLLPQKTDYLVACVGDSFTSGFGLDDPETEAYPAVLAALEGEYSFQTENYSYEMLTVDLESPLSYAKTMTCARSLKSKADIVVIALGANDAIWSSDQTDFAEDYKMLLNMYIKLNTAPRVIVITPPRLFGLEKYDDLMAELVETEIEVAKELELDVIDVYALSLEMEAEEYCTDKLHMNAEGHRYVAGFIYDELSRLLSE